AAMVRAVDSPAVRLLFDVGHLTMMGEDILPALAAHWDIIGGIQVADIPGRVEPGAGTLDWIAILGAIADRGYAGLVEVELLTEEDSAAGEARLVGNLRAIDAAMMDR
ncbi:MAG: TIM barrel protein, partial [Novosphingobium sp.]|nr:TIM barrel protein [Novosphingobium sp.]